MHACCGLSRPRLNSRDSGDPTRQMLRIPSLQSREGKQPPSHSLAPLKGKLRHQCNEWHVAHGVRPWPSPSRFRADAHTARDRRPASSFLPEIVVCCHVSVGSFLEYLKTLEAAQRGRKSQRCSNGLDVPSCVRTEQSARWHEVRLRVPSLRTDTLSSIEAGVATCGKHCLPTTDKCDCSHESLLYSTRLRHVHSSSLAPALTDLPQLHEVTRIGCTSGAHDTRPLPPAHWREPSAESSGDPAFWQDQNRHEDKMILHRRLAFHLILFHTSL